MTDMITLYGIANCDSVKKARAWLTEHGHAYEFHDFKKQGVPPEKLARWMQSVGSEKLLNRKGSTWRKLDAAAKAAVVDDASAETLLRAHASAIKRPVVDWGNETTVGFDAASWASRT